MEDSSEEENGYETAEDITSASDSDKEVEGDLPPKEPINKARKSPNGLASARSRYTPWRNHPRTIRERRQELLQLMGLSDERVYRKEVSSSDSSSAMSLSATELDAKENSKTERSRSASVSLLPASESSPASSSESSEIVFPLKSSGRRITSPFASLDEACTQDEPSWSMAVARSGRNRQWQGIKPGSASPATSDIASDRISATSGAVLRGASDYSAFTEAQKRSYISGLRSKQEKAYLLPENTSICSSSPQTKVEASQIEGLFSGHSSSSERTVAGISESGNLGCFKELSCRVKDLDTGKEFVVHEAGTDGIWTKVKEVSTGRELTLVEFERLLGLSPILQEARKRERAAGAQATVDVEIAEADVSERKKRGLLRIMTNAARYVKGVKAMSVKNSSKEKISHETYPKHHNSSSSRDGSPSWQPQKVKVRANKKSSKEFSDLYMVQEFRAHQGPIWALKFSFDGQFLATGGQDCVVRIWEIKGHRSPENGESNRVVSDSSDAKFDKTASVKGSRNMLNNADRIYSQASSLDKSKNDNAKVIQLPKVFLVMEKALRSFHGHTKDVLDLAWSQTQFLVSSSMDKTVRLWHILHEECLKIFSHHDYVTCIEFNPVDDRYFLSGSLDDKLRIWNIIDHQVVHWVDLREMVTAACYTPDGKGAVVGSHKGTCRMYKLTGDKLQIEAHINVLNKKKKKYRGKKITGLQYMPGNPHKLLVTSNDSRIRVYNDLELSCKLKGFRNANSQISASFSSGGNYVVSASEDSRVYVWNTLFDAESASKAHQKHENKSYEGFSSRNVTIAVTWPGTAPSPALSQIKQEKEAKFCDRNGESVSPYGHKDLIDCESLPNANGENGSCGCSSNGGSICRCAKLSTPYFCSPTGDGTGNDLAKLTQMNGTQSINQIKRYNFWPNDDARFRQSSTSPVQSLPVQDSSMPDSGFLYVSKRNTCHFQSPGFEKCFGSGDNASKVSATWPEEKLPHFGKVTPQPNISDTISSTRFMSGEYPEATPHADTPPVCDFVILTATLEGDLRTFQNYRVG